MEEHKDIAEISDYIPTPEEEQKILNSEKQAEEDIARKNRRKFM